MEKGLIIHTLITNPDGLVLVIRRADHEQVLPGQWDIPGGKLEDGEDPVAGAVREIKEETGLAVGHLRLIAYTSNLNHEKNKQFIRLIFRAQIKGGSIVLNPDEHDAFRWIYPANPPDLPYVDYLPNIFKDSV